MLLQRVRLVNVGPFADLEIPLADESSGTPRRLDVVHGGPAVGKSMLLSAIGGTRPGHAAVPNSRTRAEGPPPHVVTDWILGDDDPERPHPLRVVTPNVRVGTDEAARLQRKEQAHFEREARRGGFMLVAIPANRWFSRQAMALHAPLRSVAHYDLRNAGILEDSTRFDLTREVKAALAYAELSARVAAAGSGGAPAPDMGLLGAAMRHVVDALVVEAGYTYAGLEARSLEPWFEAAAGVGVSFDGLPAAARNLVAFAAIAVRNLWAARPGVDPREAEGVVLIDDADLHLSGAQQERLPGVLAQALPRVQWIVTTASARMAGACRSDEVVALRRESPYTQVELYMGPAARTH